MANFWQTLSKPFLVLAPMDDVTDIVFREIITGAAKPDVFFTEFTSSDGLISPGYTETLKKLTFTENQRPIVAQIWGTDPVKMYKSAKIVRELKFDGVDINMGCPDKTVMKRGAGAAHIVNPTLAKEIIQSVKEGAKDIAVSIKTRIGHRKNIAEVWIPFLLEQKIDALTIHGRVAVKKSEGKADWEAIGKAVTYRNEIAPETLIIGNGDIVSYREAEEMRKLHKVDGIMIGRGIFTDPWLFEKTPLPNEHSEKEYIMLLIKHIKLFSETWGENKNFEIMKKFFKMYIREFRGANQLRQNLMACKTGKDALNILAKQ